MVCTRASVCLKVCVVFCATSFAAAAAETSSAPADPLAAAKRDYEAFKAGSTDVTQRGGLNLHRSVPALETTTDAPTVPSPIQRARRIESLRAQRSAAQSKNWLIDGVKKNSGSSAAGIDYFRGDDGSKADPRQSLSEDFLNESLPADGANERGNIRAQEVKSTAEMSARRSIGTYNPLDGYMSKWMTPGDFELLKSKDSNRSRPAESTIRSGSFHPLTSVPFPPVMDGEPADGGISFDRDNSPLILKRDNPYIVGLPAPADFDSTPAANDFPKIVSPRLMPSIPARLPTTLPFATPPAKPSLADALKGEDDAKFFKQLKRF